MCMLTFSLIGLVWNSVLFWQLISCYKLSSCQKKFDFRNWLRDTKSYFIPKINLIGWVYHFDLFWQLISCCEQSSWHKKILTLEIDWGIANLTVCQKLVWLVKFEILLHFDSCQAVAKKFCLQNFLRGYESNCVANLSSLGCV